MVNAVYALLSRVPPGRRLCAPVYALALAVGCVACCIPAASPEGEARPTGGAAQNRKPPTTKAREEGEQKVPDTLTFDARFEIKGDRLILTYEVVNKDARDVYLINRLYKSAPRFEMNPDLIYAHLLRDEVTVWLNKKIPDIPTDRNVYMPVSPYVTPVRAGAKFTERVSLPLPLREYREYSESPAPSGEPHEQIFKKIYFTLGYMWSIEGMKEEMQNVGGESLMVPIAPPAKRAQLEFGELKSRTENIDIPVLVSN